MKRYNFLLRKHVYLKETKVIYLQDHIFHAPKGEGGGHAGRMMVLVNFQCQGVLLVWMTVGQGPIV